MDLGWIPGKLTVHLTRGGGFRPGLESTIGWNPGDEVALVFTPPRDAEDIEWPATIEGDIAMWQVSAADVIEVLDAGVDSVWLRYTGPGLEPDVWEKGHVHVY